MAPKTNANKQNAPRGTSRAPQYRKSRQEAPRRELATRNYISQLQKIADCPDPGAKDAYQREYVPMVKERISLLFKMQDKTLPNLKPVDLPVTFPLTESLTDQAASILRAVATGKIGPSDATALMTAVAAQGRVLEVDELERWVSDLETRQQQHGRRP